MIMGTRHIVEVIKDNKIVIRQYGQWDGYAATAGYTLRNFIKENGKERLDEILDKVEPIDNIAHGNEPDMLITDKAHILESMMTSFDEEIAEYRDKIRSMGIFDIDMHIALVPILVEKFGFDRTAKYYTLTRDTGYKVLDVLNMLYSINECRFGKIKIPVYIEEDFDTGRRIVINMDDETFACKYFGKEKTWTFDKLPTLTELRKVDKW
jgi:hypothetical protein